MLATCVHATEGCSSSFTATNLLEIGLLITTLSSASTTVSSGFCPQGPASATSVLRAVLSLRASTEATATLSAASRTRFGS